MMSNEVSVVLPFWLILGVFIDSTLNVVVFYCVEMRLLFVVLYDCLLCAVRPLILFKKKKEEIYQIHSTVHY